MRSYCVKERRLTENIPGSEEYFKTRNGRTMMMAICASCGTRKTQFVSQKEGCSSKQKEGK